MFMRTVIILTAAIWAGFVELPAQSGTLTYFEADSYDESSQGSSLPSRFKEQVLRSPEEGESRSLPGLLVIIEKRYEDVRDLIRGQVRIRMGEELYSEAFHDDLVEYQEYAGEDKEGFYKDREAKSRLLLESESIRLSRYHESRITTLPYNTVWWSRANSKSVFRIIDGQDVFQNPCTIVVVKRTDEELRLGFLHGTWLPIPTLGMRPRSLVTSKELELVEYVAQGLKSNWHAHPFWETSLLSNSNTLIAAKKALVSLPTPGGTENTISPVR